MRTVPSLILPWSSLRSKWFTSYNFLISSFEELHSSSVHGKVGLISVSLLSVEVVLLLEHIIIPDVSMYRYPTLNRWIQLQAKLQSLSDVSTSSHKLKQDAGREEGGRTSLKRPRELEVDDVYLTTDSDQKDEVPETSDLASQWSMKPPALDGQGVATPVSGESKNGKRSSSYSLMFDWENEAPYSEAVQR